MRKLRDRREAALGATTPHAVDRQIPLAVGDLTARCRGTVARCPALSFKSCRARAGTVRMRRWAPQTITGARSVPPGMRNAEAWLRWSRSPDLDHAFWHLNLPTLIALLPPPGEITLDVGCGEGRVARALTALGHVVVGVESSPALARAGDRGRACVRGACLSLTQRRWRSPTPSPGRLFWCARGGGLRRGAGCGASARRRLHRRVSRCGAVA
jgi:Methyltransferase domain